MPLNVPHPDDLTRVVRTAWVVGILEACGSFVRERATIRITVIRPDEETVMRLCEFSGCGRTYTVRNGQKVQWKWTVSSPPDVDRILALVIPWLSPRRKNQIERLLRQGDDNGI